VDRVRLRRIAGHISGEIMKVLMVHNRYQQRGGEDAVVDAEACLLAARGVEVQRFDADNDAIQGFQAKVQVSLRQFAGSPDMRHSIAEALTQFRPDVVHVHNWFPKISASIFRHCKAANIPVVHTIHNYRLLCVGATLFRDGHVCEDCIGSTFRTPGIVHKCYRGSNLGSAAGTAGMLAHWAAGTWHHSVDRFIALTEFSRRKLIEGGLPGQKIVVKPNFVEPEPEPGPGDGNYVLYAGRLTEEKGLRTLLECWKSGPELPPLRIVGDGPLRNEVQEAAASIGNVHWLGMKTSEEVVFLMKHAKATLCPSLWYEGMPRVVIESFAVGTPVIASNIGGYPEMIVDGESGALFASGDAGALLNCMRKLEKGDAFGRMRPDARLRFLAEYTGEKNFSVLLHIYRTAMYPDKSAFPIPASPGTCLL
jgi:glycosyltransferase involved in cell wall biosynthesis